MPSVTKGLVALAIASLAYATPVERGPKGFSVKQNGAKKQWVPGPMSVAKTYKKFGKDVPQPVQDAVDAILANGEVTATPDQYDEEYLAPVTIGGQTLNLDFDTGSADLYDPPRFSA